MNVLGLVKKRQNSNNVHFENVMPKQFTMGEKNNRTDYQVRSDVVNSTATRSSFFLIPNRLPS